MRKLYSAIRFITLTVIISAITLYTLAFILLSLPYIQEKVKDFSTKELSQYLGAEIFIDHIEISPFSKLSLCGVYIPDQKGDTLLHIDKLAGNFSLPDLILHQEVVINNLTGFGLDARITQATPDSPTNLQFIIDKFFSQPSKNPMNVRIRNVIVHNGSVRYDILSEPHREDGLFDANHIKIDNLHSVFSAKITPHVSKEFSIKRLALDESSGFSIDRLQCKIKIEPQQAEISDFKLQLPNSSIEFAPLRITDLNTFTLDTPIELQILPSTITLSDWGGFNPLLADIDTPLDLSVQLSGTPNNLSITPFKLNFGKGKIVANSQIELKHLADSASRDIFIQTQLAATPRGINLLSQYLPLTHAQSNNLSRLGNIDFDGTIQNTGKDLTARGSLKTDLGEIYADVRLGSNNPVNDRFYQGLIETEYFDLNGLFPKGNPFGEIAFKFELDSYQERGQAPFGTLAGTINRFDFQGYPYENISLNGEFGNNLYNGVALIEDPNGTMSINGVAILNDKDSEFDLTIQASDIRPAELQLLPQYPNTQLGFYLTAGFTGNNLDNAEGAISVDDLFISYNNKEFELEQFIIEASNQEEPQIITITSDILNGEIEGEYQLAGLASSLRNILAETIPSLFPSSPTPEQEPTSINDFQFHFDIENNMELADMFELPITFTDRFSIKGRINSRENTCFIESEIPHFWLKNTYFKETKFLAQKDNNNAKLSIQGKSHSKKQTPTSWSIYSEAGQDLLDLNISWNNDTLPAILGEMNTTTYFSRTPETNQLLVQSFIKPTNLIFNDTTWRVKPAKLIYCDNRLEVEEFEVSHNPQYIRISGVASKQEDDKLIVELNQMDIGHVFKTFRTKAFFLGGNASGEITASHLFTSTPQINSKVFNVKNFSFNHTYLGELNLFSGWDNGKQGILFKGEVENDEKDTTQIYGHIFPSQDSIAFTFDAHRINAACLQPYLKKTLNDISGIVSGKIDFYGNYRRLNLKGDIYAENVSFGIESLNTRYTFTDRIHLSPTAIWFDNVTVYDKYNNRALGSGRIEHKHFRDVVFDIEIPYIQNLLAYDITEEQSPEYYGTVFASGSASLKGENRLFSINAVATADENSQFTLDLSGSTSASDYNFITFTDSLKEKSKNSTEANKVQENNQRMIEKWALMQRAKVNWNWDMNLNVSVDEQTQITLITDKSTGDKIKAIGNGNVVINYNSNDDDIELQGSYTLDKGSFNFSLQDIITRDFSIDKNSKVEFHGDPMATILNISAYYSLQASLLDLDESFATEKNLQQTTQQVHAILKISGDLRKPDLSFDLSYPNLERTSPEIVRRIESLISTEEMKTRQIIYLLALNRFYTPDYMNTGSNRNSGVASVASVASSTLSSQLSNLLGELNENWNIAPNFRSDKGDFSDMEVELALSSQLLNNRLIFNGNFGYRNNVMSNNNNNFIGDFDLEYLLNPQGTVRLKAYNRYNDRNYYIKSALTTQGVGVMLRKDFDNWRNLFRREKNARLTLPDNDNEIDDENPLLEEEMDSFYNDFESNEAVE